LKALRTSALIPMGLSFSEIRSRVERTSFLRRYSKQAPVSLWVEREEQEVSFEFKIAREHSLALGRYVKPSVKGLFLW